MIVAQAVTEGDFSAEFLSKYEERWERHIGWNLNLQAKVFGEVVSKVKSGEKTFEGWLMDLASRLRKLIGGSSRPT